jgi:hypothetical protein
VNVLFHDPEVLKIERKKRREDVIVVPSKVDHLRVSLLQLLQDNANEAGVCLGPVTRPCQLPAIDDVTIQDQTLTANVAEKMIHLLNLTVRRAEMHVRQNYGPNMEQRSHQDGMNPGLTRAGSPCHATTSGRRAAFGVG